MEKIYVNDMMKDNYEYFYFPKPYPERDYYFLLSNETEIKVTDLLLSILQDVEDIFEYNLKEDPNELGYSTKLIEEMISYYIWMLNPNLISESSFSNIDFEEKHMPIYNGENMRKKLWLVIPELEPRLTKKIKILLPNLSNKDELWDVLSYFRQLMEVFEIDPNTKRPQIDRYYPEMHDDDPPPKLYEHYFDD